MVGCPVCQAYMPCTCSACKSNAVIIPSVHKQSQLNGREHSRYWPGSSPCCGTTGRSALQRPYMRLCLSGACRHGAASRSCRLGGIVCCSIGLPQQVKSGQAVRDTAFKSELVLDSPPYEPGTRICQTEQGVPIVGDALPLNSLLRLHGDPQALVQAA